MNFAEWLDIFVEEKEINVDRAFDFEIDGTWHLMPVGVVIEYIKQVPKEEQEKIKTNFVKIDFYNGDVYHFLEYMARGIAMFN